MKTLKSIVWRYPFSIWTMIALGLALTATALTTKGDEGAFSTLFWLTSPVWCFPIWLPHQVLMSLNGGYKAFLEAAIIGAIASLVVDLMLQVAHVTRRAKHK